MNVGDVCLVKIPKIQIQTHVKFDVGCKVLIIQGENAGKIGQVDEIKNGMFSLPKRTVIRFEDRSVEMPISIVMPVGNNSPILEVFA